MENIYRWLFGENKWEQKKKLKRLLLWTTILAVISLLLLVDGPKWTMVMVAIIILMWGWNFVSATAAKAGGIIAFFDNDIAIFVITLILWLFLGLIGGIISLILGIIRFIQLCKE